MYEYIVTLRNGSAVRHHTDDGWLAFEVSPAGALLVILCEQTPFDTVRTVAGAYAPGEWAQADRLALD